MYIIYRINVEEMLGSWIVCKLGDCILNEAVTRRQETCQNGMRYVTVALFSSLTTPETCRRVTNRIKRLINTWKISHIKVARQTVRITQH
jgi:hypothetical protein